MAPTFNPQQTPAYPDRIVGELDLAITFSEIALAAADRGSARRNMVLARQLLDSIEDSLGRSSLETKPEVQSRLDRVESLSRQYADAQPERGGNQCCREAALLESSIETVAIRTVLVDQPTHTAPHRLQTEHHDAPAAVTRPGRSSQSTLPSIAPCQQSRVDPASTWARCLRQGRIAWREIHSLTPGSFLKLVRWLKSTL